jgi:hypothetical protein
MHCQARVSPRAKVLAKQTKQFTSALPKASAQRSEALEKIAWSYDLGPNYVCFPKTRFLGKASVSENRSRASGPGWTENSSRWPIEDVNQGDRDILFDTRGKPTYTTCAREDREPFVAADESATCPGSMILRIFPPSQIGIRVSAQL